MYLNLRVLMLNFDIFFNFYKIYVGKKNNIFSGSPEQAELK